MYRSLKPIFVLALWAGLSLTTAEAYAQAKQSKEAKMKDALSAAPEELAKNATVMDWDQTVLR